MRKPEFVYITFIGTTPEKLCEALTEAEFGALHIEGPDQP